MTWRIPTKDETRETIRQLRAILRRDLRRTEKGPS